MLCCDVSVVVHCSSSTINGVLEETSWWKYPVIFNRLGQQCCHPRRILSVQSSIVLHAFQIVRSQSLTTACWCHWWPWLWHAQTCVSGSGRHLQGRGFGGWGKEVVGVEEMMGEEVFTRWCFSPSCPSPVSNHIKRMVWYCYGDTEVVAWQGMQQAISLKAVSEVVQETCSHKQAQHFNFVGDASPEHPVVNAFSCQAVACAPVEENSLPCNAVGAATCTPSLCRRNNKNASLHDIMHLMVMCSKEEISERISWDKHKKDSDKEN